MERNLQSAPAFRITPACLPACLVLLAGRLCKEVEAAREEANDNCKFLRPLRKLFEKLDAMDDFQVGHWVG